MQSSFCLRSIQHRLTDKMVLPRTSKQSNYSQLEKYIKKQHTHTTLSSVHSTTFDFINTKWSGKSKGKKTHSTYIESIRLYIEYC